MCDTITAEERLVITLRYLASGMTQQDICWQFRIGRTTASSIVKQVCEAIHEVLAPIYLDHPSSEAQW